MKRLGTVVGAGVLLLLASACANPQENQEARTDQPTATSETTTPDRQPARTPPSGGTAVGAQQLDTTLLPQGYPVMVWTEDGGDTVGVVAQEGGCGRASVEVPQQTDTQVEVVMIETVPATPQSCTMDLRYPKLTTELDAPLGERKVVLKSEQRKR
jgi:septal ring-binding cell division protein DamX